MAAAVAVPALSPQESAFDTVRKNFKDASEHLGLSSELAILLSTPHRELRVEIPVWSDAGPLNAYLAHRVQHNGMRGAFLGGIEISSDFDRETARALAEHMTWKAALLDIPFGGAASGVACDWDLLSPREANEISRRFVTRIHALLGQFRDVLSPAVGLPWGVAESMFEAASEMSGFEAASLTGKPREQGGIPSRSEAVGLGIATVIQNALDDAGMRVPGLRFAIQGQSPVTRVLAGSLKKKGAVQVAEDDGRQSHAVGSDCDVLILAGRKNSFRAVDAYVFGARMVVEAADLAITPSADALLKGMGVTVIPDMIANGGDALCAHIEWGQNLQQVCWFQPYVNECVESGLLRAYRAARDYASRNGLSLRAAAYAIGIDRVACMEKLRTA